MPAPVKLAAVAATLTLAPPLAAADATWTAGAEAGAEYDSNVHRVEVDPDGGGDAPVAVPLARAGARFEGRGDADRAGRWGLGGQALLRRVVADECCEDVIALSSDARWDRALPDPAARVGVRASYYDVLALEGGARAFALGGADALVAITGEDDARFAASIGARDFRYKPDERFDWRGVALGARYVDTLLGGDADAPATLDLALGYRLERRTYRGRAFTNGCAPGEPVEPMCFVPTALARGDLHHVADVELAYTGGVVAGAGYQLTVNDSSSFGQSLVRHRVTGSVTAEAPLGVFATGIAALQLDQYLDPLLLAQDIANQTFTSIDEENRNELSLRLSRPLGGGWTAEARWAFYADSLSDDDLRFRRQVLYGGVTWNTEP